MKTRFTLIIALALLMTGCDWLNKATEVTIPTDLVVDIPVTIVSSKAADITDAPTEYSFSASATLALADNDDVAEYLEKIREIDIKSVEVTVTGLLSGQEIYTVSIGADGVGTLATQTNITPTNNTFTPEVNETLLNQAATKLVNEQEITFTLSGTASDLISVTVRISLEADIIAGVLDK